MYSSNFNQFILDEPEIWNVLLEIPFDSTRKRMTLIVTPQGEKEKIVVMTKGADNIILPRCEMDSVLKFKVKKILHDFSCEGLRTLVLAEKIITQV